MADQHPLEPDPLPSPDRDPHDRRLQKAAAWASIVATVIAVVSWAPNIWGADLTMVLAALVSPLKKEEEPPTADSAKPPVIKVEPDPLPAAPQPQDPVEAQKLAQFYAAERAKAEEREKGEAWARQRNIKTFQGCDRLTDNFREGCLDWVRIQAS